MLFSDQVHPFLSLVLRGQLLRPLSHSVLRSSSFTHSWVSLSLCFANHVLSVPDQTWSFKPLSSRHDEFQVPGGKTKSNLPGTAWPITLTTAQQDSMEDLSSGQDLNITVFIKDYPLDHHPTLGLSLSFNSF